MATLAFALVANYLVPASYGALANTVAVAAATAAGAAVDQAYLYPALAPQKDTTGPRVDDKSVQVASEGSDLKFALGAENRFAGVVIWASDEQVGKGFPAERLLVPS